MHDDKHEAVESNNEGAQFVYEYMDISRNCNVKILSLVSFKDFIRICCRLRQRKKLSWSRVLNKMLISYSFHC